MFGGKTFPLGIMVPMSSAKMFFQKKNLICDNVKQWRRRDPFARCLAAVEPGSQ